MTKTSKKIESILGIPLIADFKILNAKSVSENMQLFFEALFNNNTKQNLSILKIGNIEKHRKYRTFGNK